MPYGAARYGPRGAREVAGRADRTAPFDLGEVVSSPTDVSRPNVVLFVTPSYDVLLTRSRLGAQRKLL